MRINTNKYEIHGAEAHIVTVKGDVIKVDTEDVDMAKKYCWHVDTKGYAMGGNKAGRIRLHSLLMKPADGMVVDHINHDKLDNRKSNLRVVTPKTNNHNRVAGKNNTSGTVGVYFNKECKKWCCQITRNGKCQCSELFNSKEEAIARRKELETIYD